MYTRTDDVGAATTARRLSALLTATGLPHGAIRQLTAAYIKREFNPSTPDSPEVRYYSYGASLADHDEPLPDELSPTSSTTSDLQQSKEVTATTAAKAAAGALSWPSRLSFMSPSHALLSQLDGANDGLVSVQSAEWGTYLGTLTGVGHLDLINWTNRAKWAVASALGRERRFNALALYLEIAGEYAPAMCWVANVWANTDDTTARYARQGGFLNVRGTVCGMVELMHFTRRTLFEAHSALFEIP